METCCRPQKWRGTVASFYNLHIITLHMWHGFLTKLPCVSVTQGKKMNRLRHQTRYPDTNAIYIYYTHGWWRIVKLYAQVLAWWVYAQFLAHHCAANPPDAPQRTSLRAWKQEPETRVFTNYWRRIDVSYVYLLHWLGDVIHRKWDAAWQLNCN